MIWDTCRRHMAFLWCLQSGQWMVDLEKCKETGEAHATDRGAGDAPAEQTFGNIAGIGKSG
jgi:hypothetical protein